MDHDVDLIGALISKLALCLGAPPAGVPGLLHSITDDYFRRIEAVEFAVKNDDGAEPRNLPKADLVLVGISRTSKTPLSTYLAQRGLMDKVLVVVTGDFGRTPKINKNGGRDHWPGLCTLALFGGGLNVGRVVGQSDSTNSAPASPWIRT